MNQYVFYGCNENLNHEKSASSLKYDRMEAVELNFLIK